MEDVVGPIEGRFAAGYPVFASSVTRSFYPHDMDAIRLLGKAFEARRLRGRVRLSSFKTSGRISAVRHCST